MAARLKVFCWSDGFHTHTVAVSSRAKALAAWGINRDIFKDGVAVELGSGADHDAALKEPGAVIDRALDVSVSKLKHANPARAAKTRKAAKPVKRAAAPKVDKAAIKRVKALRDELDELADNHRAALTQFDRRRTALDADADKEADAYDKKRDALKAKLKAAEAKL